MSFALKSHKSGKRDEKHLYGRFTLPKMRDPDPSSYFPNVSEWLFPATGPPGGRSCRRSAPRAVLRLHRPADKVEAQATNPPMGKAGVGKEGGGVLFSALLRVREGSIINERAPAGYSTATPRAQNRLASTGSRRPTLPTRTWWRPSRPTAWPRSWRSWPPGTTISTSRWCLA